MMEHRIEISEGPPCELARRLIAEGRADRNDRLVMLRDGKPALRGGVGWFADRTISEGAKWGPLYVRWKPFPGAAVYGQGAKLTPPAISLPPESENGSRRGGLQ